MSVGGFVAFCINFVVSPSRNHNLFLFSMNFHVLVVVPSLKTIILCSHFTIQLFDFTIEATSFIR